MTKYMLIDTETSGLFDFSKPADAEGQPRLAELAMILVHPEAEERAEHHFLVKPEGWELSPAMEAINGLTHERLMEQGVSVSLALDAYIGLVDGGYIVVAHNAQYDTKIMRGELRRAGIDDRFERTPNICTMRSLIDVCKIPKKSGSGFKFPKFSEAYKHFFDKEIEGQHTALGDCRALSEIFTIMLAQNLLAEPAVHFAKNRPEAA